MKKFGFPKAEHLKGRKSIELLFSFGKKEFSYPITMIYHKNEYSSLNRAGFSVPKKRFKLAVKRNQLKRKMRESFRLNKGILNHSESYDVMFIYTSNNMESYQKIESAIKKLLEKLNS